MKSKIIYANLTYLADDKVKTPEGTKTVKIEKIIRGVVFIEGSSTYYNKETKETLQVVKIEALKELGFKNK